MDQVSVRFFLVVIIIVLLSNCTNKKSSRINDKKSQDSVTSVALMPTITDNDDSIKLTALTRKLYKWHETDTLKYDGFKPVKATPTDTLYTGIDLQETDRAIEELKKTRLFADNFLVDYHEIAVRMDKELKDGSSIWPVGELSTFGDDSDMWCNCQDYPVDNYWNVIKLTNIKINNDEATFMWTWGGDFNYKVKAVKIDGNWKISYLQGFNMGAYSWDWWKKNKKKDSESQLSY